MCNNLLLVVGLVIFLAIVDGQYPQEPGYVGGQYPQEPGYIGRQYSQEPGYVGGQYSQEPGYVGGQYQGRGIDDAYEPAILARAGGEFQSALKNVLNEARQARHTAAEVLRQQENLDGRNNVMQHVVFSAQATCAQVNVDAQNNLDALIEVLDTVGDVIDRSVFTLLDLASSGNRNDISARAYTDLDFS